jgi:hypothetical protein
MRPGVRCTSGQSDQSMSMRSSLTISRRSLIQAANSSLLSPPGNWPAISLPCVHDPLLFVGHVAVANLRADRFQEFVGRVLWSERPHVLDDGQWDGDLGLLAYAEIYPCGSRSVRVRWCAPLRRSACIRASQRVVWSVIRMLPALTTALDAGTCHRLPRHPSCWRRFSSAVAGPASYDRAWDAAY